MCLLSRKNIKLLSKVLSERSERGKFSVFISRNRHFRVKKVGIVGHSQETVDKSRKARKNRGKRTSESLINQSSIKISMIITIKTTK